MLTNDITEYCGLTTTSRDERIDRAKLDVRGLHDDLGSGITDCDIDLMDVFERGLG